MKTVCLYCGAVLVDGDPGEFVSHGACRACMRRELEKHGIPVPASMKADEKPSFRGANRWTR